VIKVINLFTWRRINREMKNILLMLTLIPMVTSTAYAQNYPLFDPDITTAPGAMLDPNNF
jgi:hypothetical protein